MMPKVSNFVKNKNDNNLDQEVQQTKHKNLRKKKRKARVIRKVSSCGKRKYNLGRGKRRNQKKKAMIRNVWRFC